MMYQKKDGLSENIIADLKDYADTAAEKAVDELARAVKKGFDENDRSFREVRSELKEIRLILKTDVAGLKTDVAGLKTDVAGLKTDFAVLKTDFKGFRSELSDVKQLVIQHFPGDKK